jgi:hypothetical protein
VATAWYEAAVPFGTHPTSIDPVLTVVGTLLVVALLSLLARWAFSPAPRTSQRRVPRDADPDDFGLLTPVATAPTREDAEMLREVLTSHGIRCTLAPVSHGGGGRKRPMHVLVFLGDADRAKTLVGTR